MPVKAGGSFLKVQWSTVKPRSVGSRDQDHSLNGPRLNFTLLSNYFPTIPTITHVVCMVSVIFQGSTCSDFLENIHFLNLHSFQAISHQYTAPSIYHDSIQHDFGYNTFFSWTPNNSADINSSIFAHIRKQVTTGFIKIWPHFNQNIQFN